MTDTGAATRTLRWLLPVALAAAAFALLYWLAAGTRTRIEHNERAWFEAQLDVLIPPALHDNDLLGDRIELAVPMTANRLIVYRARRDAQPIAAVLQTTTQGYAGAIELLVAVDYGGTLLGVRVLSHAETPGIGNAFELPGATWLHDFAGRSLHNTRQWALKKDGGDFDAFTSASITPRAIVKAVQSTLQFYATNRERIFTTP